ncbi:hypothetical protein CCO02nite_30660 [Cellulomonas composti]|uniref:Uncharacterized protein n=1 Tax=Cellulomonas composti TaxID=266130 RepID=A0A511JEJ1_9CELL|nr:hypothetical protein CCO02nite_30660 [Cellulomonas composti]
MAAVLTVLLSTSVLVTTVATPASACPPQMSGCNTVSGMLVWEASEAMAASPTVATAATATGVSGISLSQVAGQTGSAIAGTAAGVALGGWVEGKLTTAPGGPEGLEGLVSLAGWSPRSFYTYFKPVAAVRIAGVDVHYGGSDPYMSQKVPSMSITWNVGVENWGEGSSGGGQFLFTERCVRLSDGAVAYRDAYNTGGSSLSIVSYPASNTFKLDQPDGPTVNTKAVTCPTGYGFDELVMSRNDAGLPKATSDATRDALINAGLGIIYRTPANPKYQAASTEGRVTTRVKCIDASGTLNDFNASVVVRLRGNDSIDLPSLTCPAGSVVARFGADWTPLGGTPGLWPYQPIIPETDTPTWVWDIPTKYPDCIAGGCVLELFERDGNAVESCGELAAECFYWYVSASREDSFECHWGPYRVNLEYCSVFRDPGRILPNATIGPDGTVEETPWPPLEPDSGVAISLVNQVAQRYGDDACSALAESARNSLPGVAVPDFATVCTASGAVNALWFARGSNVDAGPLDIVELLVGAAEGPTLTDLQPECEQFAEDGTCIEGDAVPEPEPAPDPAGGAIKPPNNCLDDKARQILEESMPIEGHHMATKYGLFGQKFGALFMKYGLDINSSVNVYSIRHRGPHPWNYHNWVEVNMRLADRAASEAPTDQQAAVFEALFREYVVEPVQSDSTIVRAAYWKCRDEYRWR